MRDDRDVNVIVGRLRRRYSAFCRAHEEDLRSMSHDAVSRMLSEHILLGQRSAFELFLQNMLTGDELDRLRSDPKFTLAWRLFVDLCWMKKQIKRGLIILAGIVLLMLIVIGFLLSMPIVAKSPFPQ